MISPLIMFVIAIVLYAILRTKITNENVQKIGLFFTYICAIIALITFINDFSDTPAKEQPAKETEWTQPEITMQIDETNGVAIETGSTALDRKTSVTPSTPTPMPTPTPTPTPTPYVETEYPTLDTLQGYVDSGNVKMVSSEGVSLVLPTEAQMLSMPFRAVVVHATKAIYVMPIPAKGNGHIGTVYTGSVVWIVAETDNYYFFVSDMYTMGWNGKVYFRAQ